MTGEQDAADGAGITVEVVRGNPTDEELAALVAVLTESYVAEAATQLADDSPGLTAWEINARGLRTPLRRDVGWGRFS